MRSTIKARWRDEVGIQDAGFEDGQTKSSRVNLLSVLRSFMDG